MKIEEMINKIFLETPGQFEYLKQIPDNSIHCIITDIPYGISFAKWDIKHKNKNKALLGKSPAQVGKSLFITRGKPKNGWSTQDKKKIPLEFQMFCESFLKECLRILYPAGTMLAFTGRQYQHRYMLAAENIGFVVKDTLAWNKLKAPFRAQKIGKVIGKRNGDFSDDRRLGNLAPMFEPIIWTFKPYKIGGTITDCYLKYGTGTFSTEVIRTNLISHSCIIQNKLHETEKPIDLMKILIKTFSKKEQIIVDPFIGAGTTALAAKNLGRRFIGMEIYQEYIDISNKRLKGEL